MKETKEVLKFVIEFGEAMEKATADKKIEITEMALLIQPMMHIGPAFEGLDKVKEELKGMDKEKLTDLVSYAKEELNLDSEKLEEKIEKGLELALTIYSYIQLFKKQEEVVVAE